MTVEIVPIDPTAVLERAADPGEFVVQCVESGKAWLTHALEQGDLEGLANLKGWAETLRVATVQKQVGKDAELVATELVRRAERAIGLGIRQGQEEGTIRVKGASGGPRRSYERKGQRVHVDQTQDVGKISPTEYLPARDIYGNGVGHPGIYDLTDDVSDETFEEALVEAKAEKNLSRANVVRKVQGKTDDRLKKSSDERAAEIRDLTAKGHTARQIAKELGIGREQVAAVASRHDITLVDAALGKRRRIDSNRVVNETVDSLAGLAIGIDLVQVADLDPERVTEWAASLTESLSKLRSFVKRMKETAHG